MKLSARGAALFLGIVTAMLTMIVPSAAHATAQSKSAAPTPGSLYQLLNVQRGQCLAGRSNERVTISQCEISFSDQVWLLEPVAAAGFFRLRGLATSKCLAIIRNGNVRVSGCNDSFDDQWWRFDATGTNTYMLFNHLRGTCLAAPSANGAATSFTCTPSFGDQSWTFIPR